MNPELEKWIDKNEALAGEFSSGLSVVPSYKLIALFDGKVLVPVELLKEMQVYLSSNRLSNEIRAIIDNKEKT
jgi:hypothetical protein